MPADFIDGLGSLEMGCDEPGLWWIEGVQVRRTRRKRWVIVWEPGVRSETVESFRAAQVRIVDAINHDEPPFGEGSFIARSATDD